GFFARMMLERRGVAGFIKDRSRRIVLPFVVGLPTIMLLTGLAYVGGGWLAGSKGGALTPPSGTAHRSVLDSINLMHLWFLYYLVLSYLSDLVLRRIFSAASEPALQSALPTRPLRHPSMSAALDRSVGWLVRSPVGPFALALPT